MNQDIKNEIIEQLEKDILFGFENEDDLVENLTMLFSDEDDFNQDWMNNEIKVRFKKHQADSLNWKKPSDFDRLVKSFDELNSKEIVALHNTGYTRQEGEEDSFKVRAKLMEIGINPKGYCYYHGQDLERAIGEEKMLFIGFDSYNQDDELAKEIAEEIIEVLNKNNFNTKWNNSLDTRIEISNINWNKAFDNIDYNYGRVLEIMWTSKSIPKTEIANKKKKAFWKFW